MALPRIVPCTAAVAVGVAGVLVAAFVGGGDDTVVLRTRVIGVIGAAISAGVLDDDAAITLSSSPTPLVVRRGTRIVFGMALLLLWWSVVLTLAARHVESLPVSSMTRELLMLAVLGLGAVLVAQRIRRDARGATAGALATLIWFLLSLMPRIGRLPLPPDGASPGAALPLAIETAIAASVVLALSRDPATRTVRRRRVTVSTTLATRRSRP